MKYNDFQEPKPPKFPLFIDLRPNKNSDITKTEHDNFKNVLVEKIEGDEQQKQVTTKPTAESKAVSQALLQTSLIQQGAKHLPHHLLSKTEFIGNSQNFEKVKDPSYINYAAAFQAGFHASSVEDIKRRKKITDEQDLDETAEDSDKEIASEGLTYTHNLNLFNKLSEINPFKKGDFQNNNLFTGSPIHSLLNDEFMSPLRLLPQEIFEKTKTLIQQIETQSPLLQNATDVYSDNKIENFDIYSNYSSIENDTDSKTNIWKNWDAETTAHYLLKRHSDVKGYSKVIRQFSGKIKEQQRHIDRIQEQQNSINTNNSKIQELTKKINDLSKSMITEINTNINLLQDESIFEDIKTQLVDMEEIASLINQNSAVLSEEEKSLFFSYQMQLTTLSESSLIDQSKLKNYVENKSLEHTKNWWENVGNHIDQVGMLLPFALMADSAQTIFKKIGLSLQKEGNPNEETADIKLQKKLINDTITHLESTHFNKYSDTFKITPEVLMIDKLGYGIEIHKKLKQLGFLSNEGELVNFDPDNMFQDFELLTDHENNRVRSILKHATQGNYSLSSIDKKRINSYQREDIQIEDPYGNRFDLPELLQTISDPSSVQTYENARNTYNILFDMLQEMSGDNLNQGQLKPTIIENENGVEMSIYPNSTWTQYNDNIEYTDEITNTLSTAEGWESVENQPLSLQFDSAQAAETFYTDIQTALLMLEPVVSSFEINDSSVIDQHGKFYQDGTITTGPLRLLVDNEGELTTDGIITKNSDNFKYEIDNITNSKFFETSHWQQIANYVKTTVITDIGVKIFSKSQVNRLNKNTHKRKKREHAERKKEWDEKEYDRKISEKKQAAKRKAEQKALLNLYFKKHKKAKNELKKHLKKMAQKRKAEDKQRLLETKKRDVKRSASKKQAKGPAKKKAA